MTANNKKEEESASSAPISTMISLLLLSFIVGLASCTDGSLSYDYPTANQHLGLRQRWAVMMVDSFYPMNDRVTLEPWDHQCNDFSARFTQITDDESATRIEITWRRNTYIDERVVFLARRKMGIEPVDLGTASYRMLERITNCMTSEFVSYVADMM